MSRTLYTTCHMGTTEWRVYTTEPDDPGLIIDGDPCYATTLVDECAILLSNDVKPALRPKYILHELIHGAIHVSGLAVTQRWNDTREEVIVRQLSDHLAHALVSAGFWKTPRRTR